MSFVTSSNATAIGEANSQLSTNDTLVGYSIAAVSYNGIVTLFQSNTTTTNSSDSVITTTENTGMIIGAVIGSILGALILVLGAFVGYRTYKNKNKHSRLLDDPDVKKSLKPQSLQKNETSSKLESTGSALFQPEQQPSLIENDSNAIRDASIKIPTISSPVSHVSSSTTSSTPRVPSAAVSVTVLDVTVDNSGQCNNGKMPDVDLVEFN